MCAVSVPKGDARSPQLCAAVFVPMERGLRGKAGKFRSETSRASRNGLALSDRDRCDGLRGDKRVMVSTTGTEFRASPPSRSRTFAVFLRTVLERYGVHAAPVR